MALADAYLQRRADGTYNDNSFQAFYAINCLDHDDAIPSTELDALPQGVRQGLADLRPQLPLQRVPPARTGRSTPAARASASHATGARADPRDRHHPRPGHAAVWAKALARQLDNAVLVTRDGDGHTGYRQGSKCVDATVESYLVSGKVPKHNVRCS